MQPEGWLAVPWFACHLRASLPISERNVNDSIMRIRFMAIIAAAALAAGCANRSMSAKRGIGVDAITVTGQAPAAAAPATTAAGPRMLVRHADLTVQVEKLEPAEQRVTALAKSLGGYVENAASRSGGFSEGRRVTLRVPSTSLDAAIDSVARLGRVTARSTGAEDVTDEVVDLDARVTSLRASRDRLRQLLDRASSVTDVVAVEKELARVQGELDSLEARLARARGDVALARLTVSLEPKHVLGPLGLALAGVGWIFQKLFFIR